MANEIKINKVEGSNIIGGNVYGDISTTLNVKNNNKVFKKINIVVKKEVTNIDERDRILKKLKELELSIGEPANYRSQYQELMGIAANHISVLAPFIQALEKYLI